MSTLRAGAFAVRAAKGQCERRARAPRAETSRDASAPRGGAIARGRGAREIEDDIGPVPDRARGRRAEGEGGGRRYPDDAPEGARRNFWGMSAAATVRPRRICPRPRPRRSPSRALRLERKQWNLGKSPRSARSRGIARSATHTLSRPPRRTQGTPAKMVRPHADPLAEPLARTPASPRRDPRGRPDVARVHHPSRAKSIARAHLLSLTALSFRARPPPLSSQSEVEATLLRIRDHKVRAADPPAPRVLARGASRATDPGGPFTPPRRARTQMRNVRRRSVPSP
mgnify:CR=1 FL=1